MPGRCCPAASAPCPAGRDRRPWTGNRAWAAGPRACRRAPLPRRSARASPARAALRRPLASTLLKMGAAVMRAVGQLHRLVVAVAGPDAHGELRRVAHGPGIAPLVGRAGLGCNGAIRQGQVVRVRAERGGPRAVVAQHVVEQVHRRRVNHPLGRRLGVLVDDLAVLGFDLQDGDRVQLAVAGPLKFLRDRLAGHHAAVGKDAERVGVIEQRHLAAAQRKAQAVGVELAVEAAHAHAAGGLDDIRDADLIH